LLSRFPVTRWKAVQLPPAPVRVPHRGSQGWVAHLVRDEQRVAVLASLETPDGPLDVVATHLSYLRPWNARQLRRLLRALPDRTSPLVLMGDLNMGPRPAAFLTRLSSLADGPTFPVQAPGVQIDHLLADGVSSTSGHVVRLPVSDHCALVADL
jgi:endonuclease/exonuclease/phosphatase family metal-dependent hydrolase